MNLANKLTLSRIVMMVIFIGVLQSTFPYAFTAAFLIFLTAAITDIFDGRIARQRNQHTLFGELMDPLADKVLILSAFVYFVELKLPNGQPLLRSWMIIILLTRELAVTGLRVLAASRGENIAAGIGGKQKTISQVIAASMILAGEALRHDWSGSLLKSGDRLWDYFPVLYFTVALIAVTFTVVSGLHYFWINRHLLETNM